MAGNNQVKEKSYAFALLVVSAVQAMQRQNCKQAAEFRGKCLELIRMLTAIVKTSQLTAKH
jgi:hypothetical protein